MVGDGGAPKHDEPIGDLTDTDKAVRYDVDLDAIKDHVEDGSLRFGSFGTQTLDWVKQFEAEEFPNHASAQFLPRLMVLPDMTESPTFWARPIQCVGTDRRSGCCKQRSCAVLPEGVADRRTRRERCTSTRARQKLLNLMIDTAHVELESDMDLNKEMVNAIELKNEWVTEHRASPPERRIFSMQAIMVGSSIYFVS